MIPTDDARAPFALAARFTHPGGLRRVSGRDARRVAVVGAGMAGLVAAFELEQAGHRVDIFEASMRVGGRIWTHRFGDDTHAELGAARIGRHHGCVMHYVDALGVDVRPLTPDGPDNLLHIGGRRVTVAQAHRLWVDRPPPGFTADSPLVIYDEIIERTLGGLTAGDLRALFSGAELTEPLRDLDGRPFTALFEDVLPPRAFHVVGHATGMVHYARVSALEGLIDELNWRAGDHVTCVGGMGALVDGLVDALDAPLHLGAPVDGLRLGPDDVVLRIGGEEPTRRRFDRVIVATPASALARIEFDPPLPTRQAGALARLTYSPAARTIGHVSRRRWESESGIRGGASRTDLSIQQCWYPEPVPAGAEAPAGLIAGYRWESHARSFAGFDSAARDRSTLTDLDRLHPGASRDVDDLLHVLWDEDVAAGSGAYAFFRPGEREALQPELGRPWPTSRPRLFFAGEHLAISHASVQGAVETALKAVHDLDRSLDTTRRETQS